MRRQAKTTQAAAQKETAAQARKSVRSAARKRRGYERGEVRRFTRRSRRRRITVGVVAGLVATMLAMVAVAVYSPLLALETIRIEGTSRVDPDDIHAAIDDQLDTPLALVDMGRLERELGNFPLIRSYVTETVPPNTLVIHIVEREPIGAVAAGSVASYFGLPLLVTPTASLHPSTAAELSRRRPDFVLVLGGPAAVSNATVSAARLAAGIDGSDPRREVTRVGGADRYATAVAIAEVFERVLTEGGASPGCVIAVNLLRADGYAHVLSASTLAGALGCVIVGAEGPTGARLPTVTADYLRGFEVDGVLAGGRDVLSDAAGQQLRELLSP